MSRRLLVLAPPPDAADLSPHLRLLASYGMDASLHPVAEAFAADDGSAPWLTFSRACVPVLALLAPAWSPDAIGAFASLCGAEPLRRACAAAGFPLADGPAFTVEGCVWDGAFVAGAVHPRPAPAEALCRTARAVCDSFGVSRAYLRLSADATGRRVHDAAVIPGDAAAVALARRDGFCPVWTALATARGRRPLVVPTERSRTAEARFP